MLLRFTVLTAVTFCICFSVCAQGELPVELYLGKPSVSVSLGSVTDYDLSEPLRLAYNAGGIRVNDPDGIYGLGWSLAGAGIISREVRALPDDFKGTSPDNRSGWLYTGAAA